MNLTLLNEITLGAITISMQYLREVLTRISNTQNIKCIQTLICICHLWILQDLKYFHPSLIFILGQHPTSVSLNLPLAPCFMFQNWIQSKKDHINK